MSDQGDQNTTNSSTRGERGQHGPHHVPSSFDSAAFAQRIQEARQRRGMTQTELAEIVGVSKASVSNWESSGHGMTLDSLTKLCLALEVNPNEILLPAESSDWDSRKHNGQGGDFDPAAIGARLKEARSHRGLTQGELAERLQVTTMAVSFWERGERSISMEMLIRAAKVLDVRAADLIGPQDEVTVSQIHALGEPGGVRLLARVADLLDKGVITPKRMGILMAMLEDFER